MEGNVKERWQIQVDKKVEERKIGESLEEEGCQAHKGV